MKFVGSLLLSSAAMIAVVGAAQAADLPVKAKAIQYVKICSAYGPGFYYIPGTDTCIKLGGFIRADMLVNSNTDNVGNTGGPAGANNRFTNGYTTKTTSNVRIDTRTETEYGTVRTYMESVFVWMGSSYTANPAAPGSTIYSAIGTVPAPNNATTGNVAAGGFALYNAFIQFAGFTIGRAVSQFSAPWINYPGNNFDGLVGGGGTVTGVNQFSYTADFGQGYAVTISAQDPTAYYQAGVNNLSAGGPYGVSDYAGTIVPDIVGMFRVDQAWGLFQASAAAHDNHVAYYGGAGLLNGGTELAGHPDDKWGWAAQLALSIKNIPTGPGDTINLQAVYTDGATRYNIQDLSAFSTANTVYGGSSLQGAYQSIGLGMAPDTVFANGTQQQSIQTWGLNGAYTHNWNESWNTAVYGAYAKVSYNAAAKTLICGGGTGMGSFQAAFGAGVTSCNPDFSLTQLGTITRWTPVKNLTFSADLTYTHLDQSYAGTAVTSSGALGKPLATYELKNQDTFLLLLRAQRNM